MVVGVVVVFGGVVVVLVVVVVCVVPSTAGRTVRGRAGAGWRCPDGGSTAVPSRRSRAARKSSSVLARAASVAEQLPPPLSAACRTVSKSSAAARRWPTGSVPCRSSRRRPAARRRARAAPRQRPRAPSGPVAWTPARLMSLTVLQALGERVRQAGGADRGGGPGDVVRHAVVGRLRASRSSDSQAARASPSRGCPTLPGFSSHSPSARSRTVPSGGARPGPARRRGARTRAPRGSVRSGRCGAAGRRGRGRPAASRARTPRPDRGDWRGRGRPTPRGPPDSGSEEGQVLG